jgi:hypothetical protein
MLYYKASPISRYGLYAGAHATLRCGSKIAYLLNVAGFGVHEITSPAMTTATNNMLGGVLSTKCTWDVPTGVESMFEECHRRVLSRYTKKNAQKSGRRVRVAPLTRRRRVRVRSDAFSTRYKISSNRSNAGLCRDGGALWEPLS